MIYGRAFGNAHGAQRLYQEKFPGRRLPHHTTFSAIVQRLRGNGKFQPSTTDRGRERTEHVIDVEPEILEIVKDLPRRVRFCEWLLQKNREQPDFVQKLLTTDEATSTKEGLFNFRNIHIWSNENPYATRETHFRDRFSVNVCAGMVDYNLIAQYVPFPRLTALASLDFLNNDLGPFLENVPLNLRRNGTFMMGPLHIMP
ncbi:hypothetical protein Zmor_011266 [Zophobas morio]|uniref:DUF4817 domain-containing protein n=1 Tax=Zophobas morio TaxID=2755281 RepID=A0AA38IQ59_9CUCU|nr:hypothetical protein Zmor_011266 [Zophobas morio]